MTLREKLLSHFKGNCSTHRPSSQTVWALSLDGPQCFDVIRSHILDPHVWVLSFLQSFRLQSIAWLIRAQIVDQMNVGKNVAARRMYQENGGLLPSG